MRALLRIPLSALALALSLASCVTPKEDTTTSAGAPMSIAFSKEPRRAQAREAIPEAVRPLVPRRGVYAAGGGLVSSGWRAVWDFDAKTITSGVVKKANAPSFDKLDDEKKKPVSDAEAARLLAIADRAWRDAREPNLHPTADYDEILIVADGDDIYFLEGFGPIRGGAAAELISAIRP